MEEQKSFIFPVEGFLNIASSLKPDFKKGKLRGLEMGRYIIASAINRDRSTETLQDYAEELQEAHSVQAKYVQNGHVPIEEQKKFFYTLGVLQGAEEAYIEREEEIKRVELSHYPYSPRYISGYLRGLNETNELISLLNVKADSFLELHAQIQKTVAFFQKRPDDELAIGYFTAVDLVTQRDQALNPERYDNI